MVMYFFYILIVILTTCVFYRTACYLISCLSLLLTTLPSTEMEIEMQSRSCGPKSALGIVTEKLGGIVDADDSPCELPTNEQRISYIKSKSTSSNLVLVDQVFAIM